MLAYFVVCKSSKSFHRDDDKLPVAPYESGTYWRNQKSFLELFEAIRKAYTHVEVV